MAKKKTKTKIKTKPKPRAKKTPVPDTNQRISLDDTCPRCRRHAAAFYAGLEEILADIEKHEPELKGEFEANEGLGNVLEQLAASNPFIRRDAFIALASDLLHAYKTARDDQPDKRPAAWDTKGVQAFLEDQDG